MRSKLIVKKVSLVLLIVAMIVGLCACGNKSVTSERSAVAETSWESATIEESSNTSTSEVASTEISSTENTETETSSEETETEVSSESASNEETETESAIDEQDKIDWIQAKLDAEKEKYYGNGLDKEDAMSLNVDNNIFTLPITGAQMSTMGFMDSNTDKIISWAASNGDIREKNGYKLEVGYLNNSDNEQYKDDCYVCYIKPQTNDFTTLYMKNTSPIKMGTKMIDLVKLLHSHGYVIKYSNVSDKIDGLNLAVAEVDDTVNILEYDKSNKSWKLNIENGEITDFSKIYSESKHATQEIRNKCNMRITSNKFIISGTDDGMTSIEYDYSYTDCETLGEIYDGLNS